MSPRLVSSIDRYPVVSSISPTGTRDWYRYPPYGGMGYRCTSRLGYVRRRYRSERS
jgi:hypothetical protein